MPSIKHSKHSSHTSPTVIKE